ncbi:unnamed protein product [Rotaria sp. Silwood1]|nr:unnamed protein product [Rotaria sp. Silwood1]CAF0944951.1 unnamed protein product [Rotaria sp. Silwood1]CAF3375509.1 unnamed protein product [Rotaria sp. Silwood1]CAF3395346.1 unnamed protein product [Rotaria sp. Silwood1]CAF4603633.1 unnamed protein product [Rotaria sp. Silwood1]
MVFQIFKQINDNLRRQIRRSFLADPEKMPQRYAIIMASVLFVSIIVTYNTLFEKKKDQEGIQPVSVTDLFRERSAKKRLEHLELQRNIAKARDSTKTTTGKDL